MAGVEALLLANAPEEADRILGASRPMKWMLIKERVDFARRFSVTREFPIDDAGSRQEYLRVFDIMRDPNFPLAEEAFPCNSLHKLTFAALYLKYFESSHGTFSWDRALEMMCE